MALGKAVIGEGHELGPDLFTNVVGDALGGHAVEEPQLELFHPGPTALGPHRPPQLVGFGRGEARHVDRHLHQLLLEQRNAEGLLERILEQWVQVRDRLQAVATTDVRMDRATLDRAGPDQCDLDHEVIERARPQPGQRAHLGPALDLEHPDRVSPTQHVIDRRVLFEGGEVEDGRAIGAGHAEAFEGFGVVFLDEVDAVVQG